MKVGPGNQISSILDNVCGHSTLGKGKKSIATLDFLHILPFFTQIMPYFVRNHKYKVVLLWKTDLETNFRQHSIMYKVTASLESLIAEMLVTCFAGKAWGFSPLNISKCFTKISFWHLGCKWNHCAFMGKEPKGGTSWFLFVWGLTSWCLFGFSRNK